MDPSIREVFEKRNSDTKKEEGGVGTLMAMRKTEEGEHRGQSILLRSSLR